MKIIKIIMCLLNEGHRPWHLKGLKGWRGSSGRVERRAGFCLGLSSSEFHSAIITFQIITTAQRFHMACPRAFQIYKRTLFLEKTVPIRL